MTDHYEHLILKSLQGTLSADEKKALDAWMHQSEENRRAVEESKRIWMLGKTSETLPDFQTEQEWKKFETSLRDTPEIPVQPLRSRTGYWLRIAASVALLAACAVFLYVTLSKPEKIMAQATDNTLQVTLPDGSSVWLNRGSVITYLDDFNDDHRTLTLEGEAFFDVTKDPAKPFIIQTAHSRVRVLGTSFNVKEYVNDPGTEVHVVTGIVSFSGLNSNNDGIALRPGETAILDNSNGQLTRSTIDDLNRLAWKEKRLVFKKTALSDVVKTLQQYFKIHITIQNQNLLGCRFTSTFQDPTVEEVVEALTLSLNLNVVRKDDGYVLNGEGC